MASKPVNTFNLSPTKQNILVKGIQSLWKEGELFDYTIKVKRRKFQVHRIVLMSMSNYFKTMMTSNMVESQSDSIELKELKPNAVQKIIQFMYTSKLDITKENASEVYCTAMYLQVPIAVDMCTEFIVKHLDQENWLDVLSLFMTYNDNEAIKKARLYIKINAMKIIKAYDITLLPYDELCFFVESMWDSTEWDRFVVITKWGSSNLAERKEQMTELLNDVRYCLMKPQELEIIKDIELYQDSGGSWCELVRNALTYHKLPIQKKVNDWSDQLEVRAGSTLVVFSAGGEDESGCYHDKGREPAFIEEAGFRMPLGSGMVCGSIEFNNFLLVCVKVNGADNLTQGKLQKWYIFDPRTMKWSQMAKLHRDFLDGALVAHAGCIYAVGGVLSLQNTGSSSFKIEQFKIERNKWKSFSILRFTGKELGACAIGGKLYVSGGVVRDNDPPQDAMDCLTLSTKTWETKAAMLEPRCGHIMHEMTFLGNPVICIFDHKFRMEYYTPATNQWSKCKFSFSSCHPYSASYAGRVLYEDNVICLVDVNLREAFDEDGWEYYEFYVVPEEGTEIEVYQSVTYDKPVAVSASTLSAKLCLPPYKNQLSL